MSNDRRPDQREIDPHGPSRTTDEGQGVDHSRRSFSKAGLIAAPVIMTLSSKSALGMNYRCTVSGMISGNLSQPGTIDQCAGGLPTYWVGPNFFQQSGNGKITQIAAWPSPYQGVSPFHASFGGIFAGSMFTYTQGSGIGSTKCYSLYEVVQLTAGATIPDSRDPYQLGAHTVAALLNATASVAGQYQFGGGREYGLTPNQVVSLFNTYSSTKPNELKTLFAIWNETDAATRESYQSAISQLGLTIPAP